MQWRADEWGMARGGTTFWTEKEIVVQLPLEKNANVLLQMPASTSVSQRSSVCSLEQTRHHRGLTWHQLRSIPAPRRSFSHPPHPHPNAILDQRGRKACKNGWYSREVILNFIRNHHLSFKMETPFCISSSLRACVTRLPTGICCCRCSGFRLL